MQQNLEEFTQTTSMQSPGELQSFTFKFNNHNKSDNSNISVSDMDYFINTLSTLKSKQTRPDLIGSIITHYASKWLPELSDAATQSTENAPQTATQSQKAKKHFIEALIGIFPPDRDFIPCSFLLKLLRVANAVRVGPAYSSELERRVSWALDEARLEDLMIPCFGHTCDALFDVGLVLRLVRGFLGLEVLEGSRSSCGVVKVAKLVECYLAEVAVDRHLGVSEFYALAGEIPGYARSTDDGLYRAVDTYLKAHPGLSKQERKKLFDLIDTRKLSQEASLHAAQNDRIPVRAVLHLLLSEQTKLNKQIIDWSGYFVGPRSPTGLDHSARCYSKRETTGLGPQQQQMEIKRLKEDVLRLQSQCMDMERQIEKIELDQKKRASKLMYFSWKKFGNIKAFKSKWIGENEDDDDQGSHAHGFKTPLHMKARLVRGKNRRKSLS